VGNRIHPTAVLGPQVVLGDNNVVGPYCVLQGRIEMGDDNFLSAHVTIGTAAEVRGHPLEASWEDESQGQPVLIGSRNVFKEFASVTAGWAHETSVGNDAFLMARSHINHDCRLGDEVTMSAMSVLAGHVQVEDGANLGLGVVVHQRRTIPAGSMIGMQAAVVDDLPPYVVSSGVPARPRRLNTHRLDRLGVDAGSHPHLEAILLHGSTDVAGLPDQVRPAIEAWLQRRAIS
jgi:UDP-N-acetylglucosamine acyltransferase